MHRTLMRPGALLLAALGVAIALAGALAANNAHSQDVKAPTANGGAREWIAFDPVVGSPIRAQTLNMLRNLRIANTSTASSTYVITFERQGRAARIPLATGVLQPGESRNAAVLGRVSSGFVDGYIQVRATQPVLVGGHVDLPVQDYEQQGSDSSPRLKFLNRGTVQRVQLDFRPGCPPKPGSGCPTTGVTG